MLEIQDDQIMRGGRGPLGSPAYARGCRSELDATGSYSRPGGADGAARRF